MSLKKQALFDDDDDDGGGGRGKRETTLKVNEDYATQYEKSKQKQELRRLRTKYADVDLGKDDDDNDDNDESSSTTEDSDAELDTPAKDAAFLRMLPLLVSKDPALMQSNERVFDEDNNAAATSNSAVSKSKSHNEKKPLSVADFRRQTLLERGPEAFANAEDDDDAAAAAAALPYAHEQEELKRAFTEAAAAAADDGADDDDSGGGLRVKQPAPKLKPQKADIDTRLAASARGPTEMSKVREFWTAGTSDEGERFLRDYIVNQRWKGGSGGRALGLGGEDGGEDDDGSDVLGEDQLSLAKRFGDVDSEDESEVERQDEFEHRYNFRFEEPGGTRLLSHPRSSNVESARRKDMRSAERRKRRAERKSAQREEINAETRRLKMLARQQLSAKVEKLRKVAALERKALDEARAAAADDDELAEVNTFTEEDLDGDWDPEAHDRRMAELFGDTFYNKLRADKKKPKFEADDDDNEFEVLMKEAAGFDEKPTDRAELPPSDDEEEEHDEQHEQAPDDDDEEQAAAETADTSTRAGSKRKLPSAGTFTAMRSRLERQVEQDLGDYHDLDYEDVVAGEIKTRFRYIEVEPVSADMDELEILKTPDAAMAQLLPLKKLAPYRDSRKLKKSNWPWLKRNWMAAMRAARAEREKEREELRADRRAARESRRGNKRAKEKKSKSSSEAATNDK